MDKETLRDIISKELDKNGGLLRLQPCWVARDFLKPGKRLGLPEREYDVGDRGFICERWLASETEADNAVKHPNEGLSYLDIEGHDILLRDAVAACGRLIMGDEYASTHPDLGRLAKIFDYDSRLFYHFHQTQEDAAKLNRRSKEEAYFFPTGVELGKHPETFFGVHPYIVEENRQFEIFLPYLEEWDSDLILQHARAYLNVQGEGFHLPAGLLHAPGTALTIELQEPSDVMGVLQAKVDGHPISRELLHKDVLPEEWDRDGARAVLRQLLWKENADPYFYENHHTPPVVVSDGSYRGDGKEYWIYYNTNKFSGKRIVLPPSGSAVSTDEGVYNILVWKGSGRIGGQEVEGGTFGADELLISSSAARHGVTYENTGTDELEVLKFFGPDVNNDVVPRLRIHGTL